MNYHDHSFDRERTPHGQIGYVQIPAADVAQSAAFYETVFGWSTERTYGSFEAPGMIGQFTTERNPTATGGPVLWISVSELLRARRRRGVRRHRAWAPSARQRRALARRGRRPGR